jgi:hypothetical protein
MRAYPLRGEVGGGWAQNGTPLSAHCHFTGPKKTREFQGLTPSHFPSWWICTHPKHYAQGCINHRCIGCFMHTRLLVTLTGCIVERSRAHTIVTVETAGRRPSWLCGGSQITFLYWTSGPVYMHVLIPPSIKSMKDRSSLNFFYRGQIIFLDSPTVKQSRK